MPLSKDLREFIECLNSNKVEYLIIVALAVSWHGSPDIPPTLIFPTFEPGECRAFFEALLQFGLEARRGRPKSLSEIDFSPWEINKLHALDYVPVARKRLILGASLSYPDRLSG
jgi:hypothetical protein